MMKDEAARLNPKDIVKVRHMKGDVPVEVTGYPVWDELFKSYFIPTSSKEYGERTFAHKVLVGPEE